jgi:hypothetical protein
MRNLSGTNKPSLYIHTYYVRIRREQRLNNLENVKCEATRDFRNKKQDI